MDEYVDEYYKESLKNAMLNDGISYLIVKVEKNGRIENKEFEINEQELIKENVNFF